MIAATTPAEGWLVLTAMATTVTLRVVDPTSRAEAALDRAARVFTDVERSCTRFDRNSPLMRANAAGSNWYSVTRECFQAISEAAAAHRATDGVFDPRVLAVLESLGYDRSLPFRDGTVITPVRSSPMMPPQPWRPGLDPKARAVRVGEHPIDLGGIAKGLAVRWAAAELATAASSFLVEAGGDCYLGGHGPGGDGWRVAVEDPGGGTSPCAILCLRDTGCATSSVRLRRWQAGGREVHHLIDPHTGEPGGGDLRSVTVVDPDPARAEVWSKALLLRGTDGIAEIARHHDLPALWVDSRGAIATNPAMDRRMLWRCDRD